ncbi:MAG: sialate O-acetylesterase [Bacteroides sp.]|uniref:sialate O-acetylesterase n=1 Tax=Bacteroides sp. TaxID=29523 RepID=UPI002FC92DD2
MKKQFLFLAILLGSCCAQAKVVPNSLFTDHAVFQQGVKVPVWGTADKNESVIVEFNGQRKQAVEKEGRWLVELDAMPHGGPYVLTISGKENRVEATDIYVGEVWICSGQSNMERQLGPRQGQNPIVNWEQERDAANYPLIREYYVPRMNADEPVDDARSKWQVCSPQTVSEFSCVGYFFARDLHKAVNRPVGILFSAVGGTPAEYWTARAELEQHPDLRAIVERYDRSLIDFAQKQAVYKRGGGVGEAPSNPAEQRHVSGHYNGMIRPLQPYAIKGVAWYQGESNDGRTKQYQTLFPLMIKNWREDWKQPNLPFLFVQIAPFKNQSPEIREAQLLTLKSTPYTAMVVTVDCGDANDIHPTHKQPVGYRLSLAARALAYGENIPYSGPVYQFSERQGNQMTIHFSQVGKGLMAKGKELKGFTIAGEDKQFVPAKAEIKGNTVVVSSPHVQSPVAVRYGWAHVPDVNLFNKDNLPASPFRTDVE